MSDNWAITISGPCITKLDKRPSVCMLWLLGAVHACVGSWLLEQASAVQRQWLMRCTDEQQSSERKV